MTKAGIIGYRHPFRPDYQPHPNKSDGACIGDGDEGYVFDFDRSSDEESIINEEAKKTGLSKEELIRIKLEPFNDKIRKSGLGLIAALIRGYKISTLSSAPDKTNDYHMHERLQVGIITGRSEISIPSERQHDLFEGCSATFARGIEKAHTIDERFNRRVINPNNQTGFYTSGFGGDILSLLYFHDIPPQTPPDVFVGGLVGTRPSAIPCSKPRLDFLIGDDEVVSYLRENLKGYEYRMVEKALAKVLGDGDGIKKKISDEHADIYHGILGAEAVNDRSLAIALTEEARIRGYDKSNLVFDSVPIDVGVTQDIDFAKFFADRIRKYSSN